MRRELVKKLLLIRLVRKLARVRGHSPRLVHALVCLVSNKRVAMSGYVSSGRPVAGTGISVSGSTVSLTSPLTTFTASGTYTTPTGATAIIVM